jgi:hypothetical protein
MNAEIAAPKATAPVWLLLLGIGLVCHGSAQGPKREEEAAVSSTAQERLGKIETALRTYFSGIGLKPEFRRVDERLEVLYHLAQQAVLFRTGKHKEAPWKTREVLAPIHDGFQIEIRLGPDRGQAVRPHTLSSKSPDGKLLYETYLGAARDLQYNFSYGPGTSQEIRRGIRKAIETE